MSIEQNHKHIDCNSSQPAKRTVLSSPTDAVESSEEVINPEKVNSLHQEFGAIELFKKDSEKSCMSIPEATSRNDNDEKACKDFSASPVVTTQNACGASSSENEDACIASSRENDASTASRRENEDTCTASSRENDASTVSRRENEDKCTASSRENDASTASRRENEDTCTASSRENDASTASRRENEDTCTVVPSSENEEASTIFSSENQSTFYLEIPREPGKHIFVVDEPKQINLLKQSSLCPIVCLGSRVQVPESSKVVSDFISETCVIKRKRGRVKRKYSEASGSSITETSCSHETSLDSQTKIEELIHGIKDQNNKRDRPKRKCTQVSKFHYKEATNWDETPENSSNEDVDFIPDIKDQKNKHLKVKQKYLENANMKSTIATNQKIIHKPLKTAKLQNQTKHDTIVHLDSEMIEPDNSILSVNTSDVMSKLKSIKSLHKRSEKTNCSVSFVNRSDLMSEIQNMECQQERSDETKVKDSIYGNPKFINSLQSSTNSHIQLQKLLDSGTTKVYQVDLLSDSILNPVVSLGPKVVFGENSKISFKASNLMSAEDDEDLKIVGEFHKKIKISPNHEQYSNNNGVCDKTVDKKLCRRRKTPSKWRDFILDIDNDLEKSSKSSDAPALFHTARKSFQRRTLTMTSVFKKNAVLSKLNLPQLDRRKEFAKAINTAEDRMVPLSISDEETSLPGAISAFLENPDKEKDTNSQNFPRDSIASSVVQAYVTQHRLFPLSLSTDENRSTEKETGGQLNVDSHRSLYNRFFKELPRSLFDKLMLRKRSILDRILFKKCLLAKNRKSNLFVATLDGIIVNINEKDKSRAVAEATSIVLALQRRKNRKLEGTNTHGAFCQKEEKKSLNTKLTLEKCALIMLADNPLILPDSIQLVESSLPLIEAENCVPLSQVHLFRQIFKSEASLLRCLLCMDKVALHSPVSLRKHYQKIHKLAVYVKIAKFKEDRVFIYAPSEVTKHMVFNHSCHYCGLQLKTPVAVYSHYSSVHFKTVRLVPQHNVDNIEKFIYCSLCDHLSIDLPSHYEHMADNHRMQTYSCRFCTFFSSSSNELIIHVSKVHILDNFILCDICDNPSIDYSSHYQHLANDHRMQIFDCCHCPFYSTTSAEILSHIQKYHRLHKKYFQSHCTACSKYILQQEKLKKHIMLIHVVQTGFKIWSCKNCLYPFENENKMMNHVLICPKVDEESFKKHNKDILHQGSSEVVASNAIHQDNRDPSEFDEKVCFLCGIKFSNSETCTRHLHHVHMQWVDKKESTPCGKKRRKSLCAREFPVMRQNSKACEEYKRLGLFDISPTDLTDEKNLIEEMVFPNKTRHFCHVCTIVIQSYLLYYFHMYYFHELQKVFKCAVTSCKKTFIHSFPFQQHAVYHNQKTEFYCSVCDEVFADTHDLYCHLLSRGHEFLKEEALINGSTIAHNYRCNVCHSWFGLFAKFIQHMETEDHKYDCHICGVSFVQFMARRNHIEYSHPEVCKLCEICGREFPNSTNLLKHFTSHNIIFQCTACDKKFLQEEPFKMHSEVHVPPLLCPVVGCKMRFTKRSALFPHFASHKLEGMLRCILCKKVVYSYHLIKHMETLHCKAEEKTFSVGCERGIRVTGMKMKSNPVVVAVNQGTSKDSIKLHSAPVTKIITASDICKQFVPIKPKPPARIIETGADSLQNTSILNISDVTQDPELGRESIMLGESRSSESKPQTVINQQTETMKETPAEKSTIKNISLTGIATFMKPTQLNKCQQVLTEQEQSPASIELNEDVNNVNKVTNRIMNLQAEASKQKTLSEYLTKNKQSNVRIKEIEKKRAQKSIKLDVSMKDNMENLLTNQEIQALELNPLSHIKIQKVVSTSPGAAQEPVKLDEILKDFTEESQVHENLLAEIAEQNLVNKSSDKSQQLFCEKQLVLTVTDGSANKKKFILVPCVDKNKEAGRIKEQPAVSAISPQSSKHQQVLKTAVKPAQESIKSNLSAQNFSFVPQVDMNQQIGTIKQEPMEDDKSQNLNKNKNITAEKRPARESIKVIQSQESSLGENMRIKDISLAGIATFMKHTQLNKCQQVLKEQEQSPASIELNKVTDRIMNLQAEASKQKTLSEYLTKNKQSNVRITEIGKERAQESIKLDVSMKDNMEMLLTNQEIRAFELKPLSQLRIQKVVSMSPGVAQEPVKLDEISKDFTEDSQVHENLLAEIAEQNLVNKSSDKSQQLFCEKQLVHTITGGSANKKVDMNQQIGTIKQEPMEDVESENLNKNKNITAEKRPAQESIKEIQSQEPSLGENMRIKDISLAGIATFMKPTQLNKCQQVLKEQEQSQEPSSGENMRNCMFMPQVDVNQLVRTIKKEPVEELVVESNSLNKNQEIITAEKKPAQELMQFDENIMDFKLMSQVDGNQEVVAIKQEPMEESTVKSPSLYKSQQIVKAVRRPDQESLDFGESMQNHVEIPQAVVDHQVEARTQTLVKVSAIRNQHSNINLQVMRIMQGSDKLTQMPSTHINQQIKELKQEPVKEPSAEFIPFENIEIACSGCMSTFASKTHFLNHVCTGEISDDATGQVVLVPHDADTFGSVKHVLLQSDKILPM